MGRRKQEMTRDVRRSAILAPEWTIGWWWRLGSLCLILTATAIVSSAQDDQPSTPPAKFTTLLNFDDTSGAAPDGPLVQGTDGSLYGTTFSGGANTTCEGIGCGTLFKVTPGGTLTTLYNFCSQPNCTDGGFPSAALVLGTDGNFYGITEFGGTGAYCPFGAGLCGTLFKITPGATLTTLYNWCSQPNCTDGFYVFLTQQGTFVQATDGNFYGSNSGSGNTVTCTTIDGCGTVFKMSPRGALTTLHSFCSQSSCPDGSEPWGLIQATDGNFYGTTFQGGANGGGTVFKVTPRGALTTLYSFCAQANCTDGEDPFAPLIQATDGNFYGTTTVGGTGAACRLGSLCGTVFEITPGGTLTTLYSFCSQTNCTDGSAPLGGLVQAADGNFYGTAGPFNGTGTIFRITPAGTLATLHTFSGTDGAAPNGFVQATNGTFYGTTAQGGTSSACSSLGIVGCGTIYSLGVGLGPFVETVPTSGKAGSLVKILGTNLTGASSVTFNGTPAVFKVVLPSAISATVPEGATSGRVEVTTPLGTLKSNVPFRVRL